jgi:hypothetical protein
MGDHAHEGVLHLFSQLYCMQQRDTDTYLPRISAKVQQRTQQRLLYLSCCCCTATAAASSSTTAARTADTAAAVAVQHES